MTKRSVLVGVLFVCLGRATAATHVVMPDGTGDFPTIQAAIVGTRSPTVYVVQTLC